MISIIKLSLMTELSDKSPKKICPKNKGTHQKNGSKPPKQRLKDYNRRRL